MMKWIIYQINLVYEIQKIESLRILKQFSRRSQSCEKISEIFQVLKFRNISNSFGFIQIFYYNEKNKNSYQTPLKVSYSKEEL